MIDLADRDEVRAGPRRGVGCLLTLMGGLALLGMFGASIAGFSGALSSAEDFVEVDVERHPEARRKLAVVEIRGVLVEGPAGLMRGRGVTGQALKMLDHAAGDPEVDGILLHIDTPGGSVTDADLLHERVRRLREDGKTVVVHMGDLCASGGYYIAVAADAIWASPTTVTGSIGVIIQSLNVAELLAQHGVTDESIMSGPNKGLLSPTRPMTDAQRALLQGVVDDLHGRFVELVAKGRKLDEAVVRGLADGRIFTAAHAKEAGLVDEVGYRRRAIEKLKQLTDGGPFNVVRYQRRPSLWDLARAGEAHSAAESLASHLLAAPRAMYLYAPLAAR